MPTWYLSGFPTNTPINLKPQHTPRQTCALAIQTLEFLVVEIIFFQAKHDVQTPRPHLACPFRAEKRNKHARVLAGRQSPKC